MKYSTVLHDHPVKKKKKKGLGCSESSQVCPAHFSHVGLHEQPAALDQSLKYGQYFHEPSVTSKDLQINTGDIPDFFRLCIFISLSIKICLSWADFERLEMH